MASLSDVTRQYMDDYRQAYPRGDSEALWKKLMMLERKFKAADSDNSGDMDLEEIIKALNELGRTKTKQQMKDLVSKVDDDNSGTLRFREFINLMLMEEGFIKDPIDESADQAVENRRRSKQAGPARRRQRAGAFKRKKRGHILLDVSLQTGSKQYVISCKVERAKDLLPCDLNGYSDPYVKLYVEPDPSKSTKQKTKVQKKTLDPTFNETFVWKLSKEESLKNRRLSVTVWDWDRITKNDFMGALAFDLEDIADPNVNTSGWFILMDEKQGAMHAFPSKTSEVSGAPSPIKRTLTVGGSKAPEARASGASASLQPTNFDFLKVLGKGSFGKVFLVTKKGSKQCYALKALKKAAVVRDDDVEATLTEKAILSMENASPFLVHCYASFQTPGNLYFVMELVSGGDLMFHAMEKGSFSLGLTTFYTAEISLGLLFLHGMGIIYRDLKLDNVMLGNDGHVKIADFGLCKQGLKKGELTHTFCGTPNYLAPEIVSYKAYGTAVDWWSLGVIVFEMLNGYTLFDGDDEDELYTNIIRQRISLPRTMSADAKTFVTKCLVRNPKQRLGFGDKEREQVTSEAFFKDIKWDKLEKKQVKPPFVPNVKNPMDGANFDHDFTSLKPVVSITHKSELDTIDQGLFVGFSYTEPGAV